MIKIGDEGLVGDEDMIGDEGLVGYKLIKMGKYKKIITCKESSNCHIW